MTQSGDPNRNSPRDQIAAAYDRFSAPLFRHAVFLLADRSLAEDALQQAFAKLSAMGKRIGEIASVEAYLRTDPLTNKPLLFAKTTDDYRIYSAGYHPPADRDKNPIPWSKRWGISIRTHLPQ